VSAESRTYSEQPKVEALKFASSLFDPPCKRVEVTNGDARMVHRRGDSEGDVVEYSRHNV
jgi:hypothetical protein